MKPQKMSPTARINRYAAEHGITTQAVLQNIMLERFLRRLSNSLYRDYFVLKDGVLMAAMARAAYRSTMDLDTILRHYPLSEAMLTQAFNAIISIDEEDATIFRLLRISRLRPEDACGGFRVDMQAQSGDIVLPFSLNVTIGDDSEQPVETYLPGFFDDLPPVPIWSCTAETILAERLETILSQGVLCTRPGDFFEIYILAQACMLDFEDLKQALLSIAASRDSEESLTLWRETLAHLEASPHLQRHWAKYQRTFPYAQQVEYSQLMHTLSALMRKIES